MLSTLCDPLTVFQNNVGEMNRHVIGYVGVSDKAAISSRDPRLSNYLVSDTLQGGWAIYCANFSPLVPIVGTGIVIIKVSN